MTELSSIQIYESFSEEGDRQYALEALGTDGSAIGEGTVFYDSHQHMYCLFNIDIDTEAQRQGIGTQMLKEMVRLVGPNEPIYTIISHKPTMEVVIPKYSAQARQAKEVALPPDELQTLPIVAFLKHSNVDIDTGKLVYLPEEESTVPGVNPFDLYLFGKTGNSI